MEVCKYREQRDRLSVAIHHEGGVYKQSCQASNSCPIVRITAIRQYDGHTLLIEMGDEILVFS